MIFALLQSFVINSDGIIIEINDSFFQILKSRINEIIQKELI